jgi:hypothetical protein
MMNASKIPPSLLTLVDAAIVEIKKGKLANGFESEETDSVYSDHDQFDKKIILDTTIKHNPDYSHGLPSALHHEDGMEYDDTLKPDQCKLK